MCCRAVLLEAGSLSSAKTGGWTNMSLASVNAGTKRFFQKALSFVPIVVSSLNFLLLLSTTTMDGFSGANCRLSVGCHPFEDFPGLLPLNATDSRTKQEIRMILYYFVNKD
jgi:hypothetical protein